MRRETLLSSRSICDLIDVSENTLKTMVKEGAFPPPTHTVRRQQRWESDLVMAWIIVTSDRFGPFFENLVKTKMSPQQGPTRANKGQNSEPKQDSEKPR